MKTGLVLEGGALRTIFSSGVCDALLDGGVMVDYVIGVSAGIAYGVSLSLIHICCEFVLHFNSGGSSLQCVVS